MTASKGLGGEFPSCPVARTWHFHCMALVQSLLGQGSGLFWGTHLKVYIYSKHVVKIYSKQVNPRSLPWYLQFVSS